MSQKKLFEEQPSPEELLKRFMEEQFDFDSLKKMGVFGKEIKRRDYKAQAERLCEHFGFKTIYEFGAIEIRCHITYGIEEDKTGIGITRPLHVDEKGRLRPEPFITVTPSIYE